MERGHSGAQQDSEREDIKCAVRPLAAWLLRYCVITDLHRVILDWKSPGTAALGHANVTVIVLWLLIFTD